jgi:hypothetical protein
MATYTLQGNTRMASLESVRREALSLPREDRAALALELALSVEPEPGYEEAWSAELNRRWRQVEEGNADLLDWSDAEKLIFDNDDVA